MKLLVLLAIISNSLCAQNFLEGTPEWSYCYECISFGWNYKGQTTIKYDSDINHQDSILKLFIVSSHYENQSNNSSNGDYDRIDSIYLYEEESKIFKWYLPSSNKELLYDFNAQLNDTLLLNNSNNNQFDFILDSIGTTTINGLELKTQKLKVDHNCFPNNKSVFIIDKIGAINMDYFEIINSYSCGVDACIRSHQFNSYTNEALGINYEINETCEGATSTDNMIRSEVNVFPNPAINYINIENYELSDKIEIYNTSGSKVFSKRISSEIIDFDLDSGVYLILLTKKNELIKTFKLYIRKSG